MRTSNFGEPFIHITCVQRTKFVALVCFVLLLSPQILQIWKAGGAANASDSVLIQASAEVGNDPWTMFRHDSAHTGYSSSRAPNSNYTVWEYLAPSAIYSSPAATAEMMFVGTDGGRILALGTANGTLMWSYTTGGRVWSSPSATGGMVFVGSSDNNLYALDAAKGTLVWSYTTGGDIFSSPTVVHGRVFVGSVDGNVYALNATTGALLWSHLMGDVRSSPAVADGRVFIASYISRQVYALNETTGNLIWSYDTGNWIMSSPVVADGRLFIGSNNGRVYALNATNGNLLWSYTTGGFVQSSPAVSNGRVYVGSHDNRVYAFNQTTGGLVWSYATGGDVFSSPAIADGKLFAGSYDGGLYCLNETTGSVLWTYMFAGAVRSSPAIAEGRVFVGSLDGLVTAFGTHDVAVKSVTLGSSEVYVGQTVNITVVAENQGSEFETFNIMLYYNETVLETKPVWNLMPGALETVVFHWNTTATSPGLYLMKAVIPTLPGEIDSSDNIMVDDMLNIVKHPVASFTYSPSVPFVGDSVVFDASSSTPDGGYIVQYRWNFDDQNVTSLDGPIVVHTYNEPKTYNVSLTVRDSDGLNGTTWMTVVVVATPHASFTYTPTYPMVGETATFNASASTANGGQIIRYKWDFDDGNTTENTDPLTVHVYGMFGAFNVTLTVVDSEGLNDTAWLLVTVIAPPDASFTVTPTPAIIGQPAILNASNSKPNGGSIKEYRWDFGDGNITSSTELTIIHVYADSKLYNVTLTVTDSEGLNDTAWMILLVAVRDIAVIDVEPSRTIVGQGTILFISVAVVNQGNLTETFNVTAYYDLTAIGTQTVDLAGGDSTILTIGWDTTGVAKGNYIIGAEASTLWGETDTANNLLTNGAITISMLGDVTGPEGIPDGKVDIRDLAAIAHPFGSVVGDPRYVANYDLNGDGKIDIRDIAMAAQNFGKIDP